MVARKALGCFLRLLPHGWKRRLGIHLGVPDVRWSLLQLRQFGFNPEHILDVGAYRGDWARTCLRVFPNAAITCIEPQQAPQSILHQLEIEFPNVKAIQTLLGREVSDHMPFDECGSGSSVWKNAADSSAGRPMMTIDQLIRTGRCLPPQFLKLDVQGYEIEVMEGWTGDFETCEVIQCEVSLLPLVPGGPLLNEVLSYLERRGFVMFDITELIRSPSDGAVWQIDALFCREESPLRSARAWRDVPGKRPQRAPAIP